MKAIPHNSKSIRMMDSIVNRMTSIKEFAEHISKVPTEGEVQDSLRRVATEQEMTALALRFKAIKLVDAGFTHAEVAELTDTISADFAFDTKTYRATKNK